MSRSADDVTRVRSFNRLLTRQLGVLNDRYLGHRPLGEGRVLFEIGADGATPRDVRARLGLDSGYLSRLLGSLEREGLIERNPNPADRRTTRLRLTRAGQAELDELNRISDELAASALAPLTDEQRGRLLAGQAEVMRCSRSRWSRSYGKTRPRRTRAGASATISRSSASASRSLSTRRGRCPPTARS